jgi:hypothetical protein
MSHIPRPRAAGRPDAAQAVLDPQHPLARVESRVRALRRQALAVLVALSTGGGAAVAGATEALAVVLAAAVVLAFLLVALWSAATARRERAVGLIAEGRATLPLPTVQRERARLTDPDCVRALARSLESLRREVAEAKWLSLPLYVPSVIREADEEIAETIGTLRDERPGPVAAARAEQLLTGADSPLYGADARILREELRRIRFAATLRPASRR